MKVLITGGLGCIGSEATKWLIRNTSADIIVTSRDTASQRVGRVFHDVDCSRIEVIQLDMCDAGAMLAFFEANPITHVVHMAALQTPDCNKYRDQGLQINLAGTQHLIEAMKAAGSQLRRFLFASSIAVYGPRANYPGDVVPMLAEPDPVNVYGVWKLAGEQISKIFSLDTGVPTISVRPGVLYGPGRDAGLTSTPTTAMKHVALGKDYQIPFTNKQDYLYAPDVGAALGNMLVESFNGYSAFTLPSHTVDTQTIVNSIEKAADELGIREGSEISIGDETVPFICDLEYEPFLKAFPNTPHTALDVAVRNSIEVFQNQVARGWLM